MRRRAPASERKSGDWAFDKAVADRFDAEARTHIPDYERVIAQSLAVAEAAFPGKRAKVLDVGSATGRTVAAFRAAGFENVYGVERSRAMIERSREQDRIIHADSFPKAHAPFDLILANWTLHFMRARKAYLKDIHDALTRGGILVLSEKVQTHPFVHERYHDFKRAQGVSEAEIIRKAESIRGVLVPRPLEWYLSGLADIGFKDINVIGAHWCFVTMIATRR